ncbi:hypothetical protein V5O48_003490 [Marasmius crinis-equi]|uniref:Uncharacterized protein n=1 Tax=Marasmius crinis-equi TaxID=585013 RepID=A0ABR3FSP9_9AGAR
MNRPRVSILEQFDPLISEEREPATPTALDSDHEDGSDFSDPEKENTAPAPGDISMCTFFTKGSKPSYPTPVKLTKRLIDVGDVTIQTADDEEDGDSEGENGNDENGDDFCLPATPKATNVVRRLANTPRTPLADIPLQESDVVPLPRHKKIYQTSHSPQTSPKDLRSPPSLHSSLSFVINSVNATGAAFGKSQTAANKPGLPGLSDNDSTTPSSAPEIQVQPPVEDLSKSESLLNRVAAPFDMAELDGDDADVSSDTSLLAPPIPRSSPVTTSSGDPIRQSLDLHASFQLHLQSPESSFDLLNDKISFLDSHSRVLSFSLDEDSYHEEARRPAGILIEEQEDEEDTSITPTNMTPEKPSTSDENTPPATNLNAEPATPISPTPQSFTHASSVEAVQATSPKEPEGHTKATEEAEAPTLLAPFAAERGAVLSTPGYRNSVPYIPPVPALRIIKRTKRYDTHPSKLSGISSTAACPPLCTSPAPSEPVEEPQRPPVKRNTTPPATTFSRRSSISPSSDSDGKSSSAPVRPVRASQPAQPAKPGAPMPMRVAPPPRASRATASKSATTGASSGNGVGPRRVLVSEEPLNKPAVVKRPEVAPGKVVKTGMAVPARTVSAGSVPSSGVPRPVAVGSKLPAPTSGIARFRGTVPSTSAGGMPLRGVPAPRRFA